MRKIIKAGASHVTLPGQHGYLKWHGYGMYSPRRLRYSFSPVPVDGIYELTPSEPARYDDYCPPCKGGIVVAATASLIKELTAEQADLLLQCGGAFYAPFIREVVEKAIPRVTTLPYPDKVGCKRKARWWKEYGTIARKAAKGIPGPSWERIAPIVTPEHPLVIEYQNYEPALQKCLESQQAYVERQRRVAALVDELSLLSTLMFADFPAPLPQSAAMPKHAESDDPT